MSENTDKEVQIESTASDAQSAVAVAEPSQDVRSEEDKAMLRVIHRQMGEPVPGDLAPDSSASDDTSRDETGAEVAGAGGEAQDEPAPGKDATPPLPEGEIARKEAGKTTETSGKKHSPDKLKKAKDALRKWQWSEEMIESAPPAVLIARGEAAAKSQTDFNNVANERAKWKQMYEAHKAEEAVTAEEAEKAPQKDFDLEKVLEPLENREDYGDLIDPVKAGFEAMIGRLDNLETVMKTDGAQPYLDAPATSSDSQPAPDKDQNERDQIRLMAARMELVDKFPVLKDAEKWNQVNDYCYELAKIRGYHDDNGEPMFNRLVEDATRFKFSDHIRKTQQHKLSENFNRQQDGQPMDSGHSSEQIQSMSSDDKMLLALNLLGSGKDPEAVRKELTGVSSG